MALDRVFRIEGDIIATLNHASASAFAEQAFGNKGYVQRRIAPKGMEGGHQACAASAENQEVSSEGLCLHSSCSKATTPLGLPIHPSPFPRVARCSQPWALLQNPFGILGRPPALEMRLRCSKDGRTPAPP